MSSQVTVGNGVLSALGAFEEAIVGALDLEGLALGDGDGTSDGEKDGVDVGVSVGTFP